MTAEDIIRTNDALSNERSVWDAWWESLMDHYLPSKSYRDTGVKGPSETTFDRIYDTVGIESCEGLASMLTSRLSPAGEKWITYRPPPPFDDDEEIVNWYAECSRIILQLLLNSNYYTERAEANLDKAGLGTSCLYVQRGKKNLFQHKHIDIGTFNFREDDEGRPNELWRELNITAAVAAKMFPRLSPRMQKALADEEKRHTQKFKVLHYVGENPDYKPDKLEARFLPELSRWVVVEEKFDLDVSGYEAFPYEVSRMQKWNSCDQWGLAPGRKAMPAMHQANLLEHYSDLAAELSIRPRTVTMGNQVGHINYRAGGSTVVTAEAAAANLPREWLSDSRYDISKDRQKDKQDAVKRMFLQPLWQPYSEVTRDITAYEVSARERQGLAQFVPILSRHETDAQPMHARYFGIALQAGVLPPPPRKLIMATGQFIPDPVARSESRLAKMTRDTESEDFETFINLLAAVSQLDPMAVDEIDLAAGIRELGRGKNLPKGTIRSEAEVLQRAQARAQAQMEQEQMDSLEQGANTMKTASEANLGNVEEIGQALAPMAGATA